MKATLTRRGILGSASCAIVNLLAFPFKPAEAGTTVGPIRSIDSYLEACTFAAWQNRFAIVDIAADWCPFCKVIDNVILTDPIIKEHLRKVALIRVDVTEMNARNVALLQYLKADGPPTVFIIDTVNAEEIPGSRSIGNFNVAHLAGRLQALEE